MGPAVAHSPAADEIPVELLDTAEGRSRPGAARATRSRWTMLVAVATAAVLYLGFLWLPMLEQTEVAELHPVILYFGDPFEIEWTPLEGEPDAPTAYARPLPMASVDPPCVGFARLDWPEPRRHPSVAHCVGSDVTDRMGSDGIAVVRRILAGPDTWYITLFGAEPATISVGVGADSAPLRAERVYRAGRYAAILVPNDSRDLTLTWKLRTGGRYRCALAGTAGPETCG